MVKYDPAGLRDAQFNSQKSQWGDSRQEQISNLWVNEPDTIGSNNNSIQNCKIILNLVKKYTSEAKSSFITILYSGQSWSTNLET